MDVRLTNVSRHLGVAVSVRRMSGESSNLPRDRQVGEAFLALVARLESSLDERAALAAALATGSQERADIEHQLESVSLTLTTVRSDIRDRFRETAKLTQMVLELRDSLHNQAQDSARLALDDHELLPDGVARARTLKEFEISTSRLESQTLQQQLDLWEKASGDNSTHFSAQSAGLPTGSRWKNFLRRAAIPDAPSPRHEVPGQDLDQLTRSDLFDPEWYLCRYPDVIDSGMEPEWHYLRHGVFEGYDPGPEFDTVAYLDAHPDVRDAAMNPLVHYLNYGRAEGRAIEPAKEGK